LECSSNVRLYKYLSDTSAGPFGRSQRLRLRHNGPLSRPTGGVSDSWQSQPYIRLDGVMGVFVRRPYISSFAEEHVLKNRIKKEAGISSSRETSRRTSCLISEPGRCLFP
ncbi:unnamed protein product, partial [Pleuronectes platessa]